MPYHIESGRSKCKGPKKTCPSEDRSIKSGDLRLGSEIEGGQFTGVAWRHWKCTTPKVLENLKSLDDVEEDLIGFSELHEEDQERVKAALEEGHVSESEEPEGDEEEKKEEEKKAEKPKPKAKAAGKKAAAKKEEDAEAKPKKATKAKTEDQDQDKEKPEPKKRGRKPAAAKDDGEDAPKPAPKKRKNDTKDEEPTASKRKTTRKTTAA
ncbi:unnamed protein product [Umbelopsis ramanniana]